MPNLHYNHCIYIFSSRYGKQIFSLANNIPLNHRVLYLYISIFQMLNYKTMPDKHLRSCINFVKGQLSRVHPIRNLVFFMFFLCG